MKPFSKYLFSAFCASSTISDHIIMSEEQELQPHTAQILMGKTPRRQIIYEIMSQVL